MDVDLRLVTAVVDRCLRVVATVMPPVLHFDLVTRAQGIGLGVILFTLFPASITCSWFADQPPPPPLDVGSSLGGTALIS